MAAARCREEPAGLERSSWGCAPDAADRGSAPGYLQEHRRLVTLRDGRFALIAVERGIHAFTGMCLAGNSPVAGLIAAADEPANRVTSRGITEFSVPLRPPDQGP